MAEFEWNNIAKPSLKCSVCETAFTAGTQYFSVLLQEETGFTRKDFCAECFQTKRPENLYYFWKTQVPSEDLEARKAWKQRPVVDIDYVFDFFKRLEGDAGPQKLAFRFILALMLTRKKILVGDGRTTLPDGSSAQIFSEKRGGQKHTVVEPALSEEEITNVSAELGVLLGLTPPPARATVPEVSAPEVTQNNEAAVDAVASANEVGDGAKGAAE